MIEYYDKEELELQISNYLSGNSTDEEKETLLAFLASNEAAARTFREMSAVWALSSVPSFAEIENSNLVNISQVAVEKIKKELLEILSGKINEKGAKVDFLFNLTDGRDYLKVDSEKIFMILKNLIENGIIYNKNSEPEVIVKVDEKGDRYNISVEDNGIGIPIYEQDKIFERFYRIDKARTSNLGGTGLGLSIVKTLIEKCGGGLVIDSIEGKGTIFSFYILK